VERKLLTILFVDLVNSTALVTSSDPEVVRRRVADFFSHVTGCIRAHGGTVGKFAGDSTMAAFGIPQAHEDDAERAVRAGLGILESVTDIGLQARIGVESGEVLTDEDDITFATGEAINVAVRLQQAASPGELLLGPAAHRLTHGRVQAEELGPVELRGIDRPVWAWRALGTVDGQPQRTSLVAPFVGREAELELLGNTFERVVRDRRAHLFTIYGEPGVGKSRLMREFAAGVEGATVLIGRCLPYGEGITYWPLAEMVKIAAGISDDDPVKEAVDKLRACCEDEAVADLLGLASGVLEAVEEERSQQEIAWAAREWVEQLAQPQPLVLVFEDIHWAEEPLLELVEHLAAVRETPLLLICLARPELLEIRPAWGGGRLRATAIELEPLAAEESDELANALLAGKDLSSADRAALLEKTGGNPLFLEETIRMLLEQGGGGIDRIPDTVQALIAARIDRLPHEDKVVLQRAAVIGRVFWPGAVAHLSTNGDEVGAAIDDLLVHDLVLPDARSSISGESAYRFKHVLIREVAYGALSKSARAELHARFAAWLAERAGDELLEIRAYHLDQACSLRAELDGAPPADLAREAAAALDAAGRRAHAREANRSARKLFGRALELEPSLERRYQAAKAAWRMTDLPAVWREMHDVCREAEEAGDPRVQGKALAALADVALLRNADVPEALRLADNALDRLGEDDPARVDALRIRATVGWWRGDLTDHERFTREALELARRLGRKDHEATALRELASTYRYRIEPERAQPLVERARELAEKSGSIVARAYAVHSVGGQHLVANELDAAAEAFEEANRLFSEAGVAWMSARTIDSLARIAARRGELRQAERLQREAIRVLAPLEDRGALCESQRGLAQILVEQGRIEEAERYALEARETVGREDVTSGATTRVALATVRAAQGREDEAHELFREALAVVERTEMRWVELEVLCAFAQFLRDSGREGDDAAVLARLDELATVAPPGYTALAASATA
jgi:class 3 adenylate cyclase/tetratricopeptide (TPR) repeat protein